MSKNSKQTSNKVAKLASEVLRDPSSSAICKINTYLNTHSHPSWTL
ncbi:hypothetical protein [Acinetobacter baumannii]